MEKTIQTRQVINSQNRQMTEFKSEKVLLNFFDYHIDNGGFEASIYETVHDSDKDEPFSTYQLEIAFNYFGYPSTKSVFELAEIRHAKVILEGLGKLCFSVKELESFQ